ncbi:MAG: hypothetical protein AAB539_01970 [Patescibacteria group bacterium]|mgnify:CR=1 FL=1
MVTLRVDPDGARRIFAVPGVGLFISECIGWATDIETVLGQGMSVRFHGSAKVNNNTVDASFHWNNEHVAGIQFTSVGMQAGVAFYSPKSQCVYPWTGLRGVVLFRTPLEELIRKQRDRLDGLSAKLQAQ